MMTTPRQLGLPLEKAKEAQGTWGGKRPRAGRKPTGRHGDVPHRRRGWHDANHPLHVTVRVGSGLPNLRRYGATSIGEAVRAATRSRRPADVQRRRTFRVIQFSIQSNHLHLIVEATSTRALARGMQGLLSRLARAINKGLGRRGRVFKFRYHARALATPREVRNAIGYVLCNARKHLGDEAKKTGPVGAPRAQVDVCSSARWFDGWTEPLPADRRPSPVARPLTWLARYGWRRHGRIPLAYVPG